jgi:hypothetical protein
MRFWLHFAAGIGAVAAILGTLALVMFHGPGLYDPSALVQEGERAHQLDLALYQAHARQKSVDRLIAAVIAGKLSLEDAARQDRELHEGTGVPSMNNAYPGSSPEEVFCRHIIAVVAARLERAPKRRNEIVRRLEAEFEMLRHRDPAHGPY